MENSYVTRLQRKFVLSMVKWGVIIGFLIALASGLTLLHSDLLFQLVLIIIGTSLGVSGQETGSRWQKWHFALHTQRELENAWEDSNETDHIRSGDLQIEKMRVYALCTEETPYTEYKRVIFNPRIANPRPLPKEWETIRTNVLDDLITIAKDRGAVFSDGPQVDMKSASIDRDRDRCKSEPNKIFVEVAPTSYFPFAAMSNRLDEVVPKLGTTLRKLWTGGRPIGLFDVKDLESPAVIGTVTVVVTTDDLLAVHSRSARLYHVNRDDTSDNSHKPAHFVGEGMIPDDCDDTGTPDPYVTARRALRVELGLDDSMIKETKIIPTAFVFDTKRWQPVFCYIAQVPISFDELKCGSLASKDDWETEKLTPFRFDIDDPALSQLLLGRDPALYLGSNHASMALYAALVWKHGSTKVCRALRKGGAHHPWRV